MNAGYSYQSLHRPLKARPEVAPPAGGASARWVAPPDVPFRFVAVSMIALAIMAALYPWHIPLLLGSFYQPHLTTFVHVNTLGVIGATILGASYQLFPVVLQAPPVPPALARLTWYLYVPGLVAFLGGLSQGWPVVLGSGGALIFCALALYAGTVVHTLLHLPRRDLVAWHVAVATFGMASATSLGLLLALSKFTGFLAGYTLPILAAHAVLMLGGWVAPLLQGVAYRLVGMFTLTEDRLRQDWAWCTLACTAGGAWLLAVAVLLSWGVPARIAGSAVLLAGLSLFALQLIRLYHLRRRRAFDVHIPFALAALVYGLLAAGTVLFGLLSGRPASDPIWVAAGWWAIAGWAETAIQGFLYKIGTFLTWQHRYAPLAGKVSVPRLDALYGRRTALAGWCCWTTGVALAGLAAIVGSNDLALVASLSLSVGVSALIVNAIRIGRHWLPQATG